MDALIAMMEPVNFKAVREDTHPLTFRLIKELNLNMDNLTIYDRSAIPIPEKIVDIFLFEDLAIKIKNSEEVTVIDGVKYIMKIIKLSPDAIRYCFGVDKVGIIFLYLSIQDKIGCKIISEDLAEKIATDVTDFTHSMLSTLMVKIKTE